jgi:hypothetical protein
MRNLRFFPTYISSYKDNILLKLVDTIRSSGPGIRFVRRWTPESIFLYRTIQAAAIVRVDSPIYLGFGRAKKHTNLMSAAFTMMYLLTSAKLDNSATAAHDFGASDKPRAS